MAIGDIYRVFCSGTYLGEEFSNRFYYQQLNGGGGAPALANGVITDLIPAIALAQVDTVSWLLVEVTNLNDLGDFIAQPIVPIINGDRLGQGMPSFNAWGFKLERTSREMRPGSKRIVGVGEADTSGNDPTGAMLTILQGVAGAFDANISFGVDNEWAPRLVREAPGGVVVVSVPVVNSSFRWLTTQNSRKVD